MTQTWHDINDPGGFGGKNETQKSSKAVELESIQPEAAEKQEPEVKLVSAQWDPGSEGFEFNKKCALKVTAEFLRETFRKKVTCSLFSIYEGVEEDLNHQVETELDADGNAVASMTLYYGREYYKALQEQPDAACRYKAKVSHPTAAAVLESDLLEMPKGIEVDFIAIGEIHFNLDCALPCLDLEGALIDALSGAFMFAKNNPDRSLIVEGHADSSGPQDYNFTIAKRRAEAIRALLSGDMSLWNGVVDANRKDHTIEAEDYQATLKSLAMKYNWPCDPGEIDNKYGPKTRDAVKGFQTEYNAKFNGELKVDGVVGPKTWEAIGAVIRSILERQLKTGAKLDPVPEITYGYPDGNGVYSCGESCSAGEADLVRASSTEANRKVELVFYRSGDPQPVVPPAAGRKIAKNKDPVSEKGWKRQEIASGGEMPVVEFAAAASTVPPYWDPFLTDAPEKIIAAFTTNVAWDGEIKASLLNGTGEIQDLPIATPYVTPIKVEWDGFDTGGSRMPEGPYAIRLQLIEGGSILAESASSFVTLIRIGIKEISFIDSYPIRMYHDNKKPNGTEEKIDFAVPSPQWKIASLNNADNTKQRSLPAVSLEGQSKDADNYNYPFCYALKSESPVKATIGGNGFSKDDSISVKLFTSLDKAQRPSADNENIGPDAEVTFKNIVKAVDSVQETKVTLTFKFEHKAADNSLLSIGSFTVDSLHAYTVISEPQEPWNNSGFTGGSDLWISVLRLLCGTWAKDSKDVDDAATKITERIFNSGFKYDTTHGASYFTSGRSASNLKDWLKELQDATLPKKPMNCTDCGTILTSLANALGCELYGAKFESATGMGFGCHKIISIGFSNWDYPFSQYHGGTSGGFSYHEIGWKKDCSASAPIFDPCLETAKDPINKPAQDPILPTNMKFDDYKPKLVVASDVSDVEPTPSTKERLAVQ